ncbi:MAG TPA: pantoate--beta-alanine ligase, partial [Agrococcus sp.]|nr:pantoate--beta-alanine ligase [Agrococcus sp.]
MTSAAEPAAESAPIVIDTVAGVRSAVAGWRDAGHRVALVPTMGSLHAGHLALVARAAELADRVIVSVFVNPLQFGPSEDFARYPRDLSADRALLAGVEGAAGTVTVFAPTVDEMYPSGPVETRVTAGDVGATFEGAARPGHFDGVLTVVAKLLGIVTPDVVLFGEKDAQQVFLVSRMVRELDIATTVEVVETVRDDDGLALSSRNAYLDDAARVVARSIPAAITAAREAAAGGVDAALAAARATLDAGSVDVDYVTLVDASTFTAVGSDHRGEV